jgi:hypothetical protein
VGNSCRPTDQAVPHQYLRHSLTFADEAINERLDVRCWHIATSLIASQYVQNPRTRGLVCQGVFIRPKPKAELGRRMRVSCWPPPIGGCDVAAIALIQNNSGPPIKTRRPLLWQAERAVDRLWEGEVQHEASRVHRAARRRRAGVLPVAYSRAACMQGPLIFTRLVGKKP